MLVGGGKQGGIRMVVSEFSRLQGVYGLVKRVLIFIEDIVTSEPKRPSKDEESIQSLLDSVFPGSHVQAFGNVVV